jgi:hypothetical protein
MTAGILYMEKAFSAEPSEPAPAQDAKSQEAFALRLALGCMERW